MAMDIRRGSLPFLDYRCRILQPLPDDVKLRGLKEKWLLKQLGPGCCSQNMETGEKALSRADQTMFFLQTPLCGRAASEQA